VEDVAWKQLFNLSRVQEVVRHPIAVMPDCHAGMGAAGTIGTVVPTYKAIIPATVGVDIGCGMIAAKTSLREADLPTNLAELRMVIEAAVPHGRTHNGDPANDAGAWGHDIPEEVAGIWKHSLEPGFKRICAKRPHIERANHVTHLGTLGTGNHFVEVCVETESFDTGSASSEDNGQGGRPVWLMLHSGSRGVGGRIGSQFIDLAKSDMRNLISNLPAADFAYFSEGTEHFDEYVFAVQWAQDFAKWNRELMMRNVVKSLRDSKLLQSKSDFTTSEIAVNCHHNYVEKYQLPPSSLQGGDDGAAPPYVWLTRKGATSARAGELAVIPGSMGAKSYIVRGKGNEASYQSCSHGAGRRFSRGETVRRFTIADHEAATAGVECRKDVGVLDETPMAYKPIDEVIEAQKDLVDVVFTLKQILCVKG